jgi:hypothetical protein
MDTTSVAYVLCRIEDDSCLTPISEHEDIVAGVSAGKHRVEVEDFDFGYDLYAGGVKVASFAEGRIGYREWARRSGRLADIQQHRRPLRPRRRRAYGVVVAATRADSYEERTCLRCFEGRVYDVQRGAWVACERCSGSGRVVAYLYPKLMRRPR